MRDGASSRAPGGEEVLELDEAEQLGQRVAEEGGGVEAAGGDGGQVADRALAQRQPGDGQAGLHEAAGLVGARRHPVRPPKPMRGRAFATSWAGTGPVATRSVA